MSYETWINGKFEGVYTGRKAMYYFQIDRRVFRDNGNVSFTIWFERKDK